MWNHHRIASLITRYHSLSLSSALPPRSVDLQDASALSHIPLSGPKHLALVGTRKHRIRVRHLQRRVRRRRRDTHPRAILATRIIPYCSMVIPTLTAWGPVWVWEHPRIFLQFLTHSQHIQCTHRPTQRQRPLSHPVRRPLFRQWRGRHPRRQPDREPHLFHQRPPPPYPPHTSHSLPEGRPVQVRMVPNNNSSIRTFPHRIRGTLHPTGLTRTDIRALNLHSNSLQDLPERQPSRAWPQRLPQSSLAQTGPSE